MTSVGDRYPVGIAGNAIKDPVERFNFLVDMLLIRLKIYD